MTPSADRQPFDPTEDERLVERCLAGDARAWEALVTRYERLVYAIGRGYRLSDEDLGDVFQEVFAALVRGLPRLREPRTLCRWLSSTTDRIARTTAFRTRRDVARTERVEDTDDRPGAGAEPPGADLERLEEQALVRAAMARLGERCRELLAALYYEDPPPAYAALAVRLHVPIGSLGPTRARCMERLQVILASGGFAESRISPPATATSPDEREGSPPPGRRPRGRVRGGKHPPSVQEAG